MFNKLLSTIHDPRCVDLIGLQRGPFPGSSAVELTRRKNEYLASLSGRFLSQVGHVEMWLLVLATGGQLSFRVMDEVRGRSNVYSLDTFGKSVAGMNLYSYKMLNSYNDKAEIALRLHPDGGYSHFYYKFPTKMTPLWRADGVTQDVDREKLLWTAIAATKTSPQPARLASVAHPVVALGIAAASSSSSMQPVAMAAMVSPRKRKVIDVSSDDDEKEEKEDAFIPVVISQEPVAKKARPADVAVITQHPVQVVPSPAAAAVHSTASAASAAVASSNNKDDLFISFVINNCKYESTGTCSVEKLWFRFCAAVERHNEVYLLDLLSFCQRTFSIEVINGVKCARGFTLE